MNKFGLGKGLADIKAEMGDISNISVLTAGAERVAVRQIPLIQICANAGQPRKTFDSAELSDLADSIRVRGVLQPILVRAVKNSPHMYEIVAGERRYRASKMAGLTEIPALVKTLTDENAMEIALIENVQRENLNPIEEGAAYKNLMEFAGYSLDDVSRLIGKSTSYIRNIMRLDVLPDAVKKMVENGELSASHARTIAVAKNPLELANEIINKKMSVSDTESAVKKVARSSKSRLFHDNSARDQEIRGLETILSKNTGLFVKIREKKGGKGDVIFSYVSRPQLSEFIKTIGE